MGSLHFDIVKVTTKQQERAFHAFPYQLYAKDPQWRAPLRFERKQQFSTKSNPALKSINRQLFLAVRGQDVIGRIVAFVN